MEAANRLHRRADRPATLSIEALSIDVLSRRGAASVVDEVSLEIWPGEIVGLIGESGSGKTMISLAVLGLLPAAERLKSGETRLAGKTISCRPERELASIRGSRVAMIPQDAMRALNPVHRVGR